jgi:hypothetical protein
LWQVCARIFPAGQDNTEELQMAEKDTVNHEIASWLAARQKQLKISETTKTPAGQVVDWVPIESQIEETIATPPTDSKPSGAQEAKTPTSQVTLDEPAAGPKGHVPILRPDVSKWPKTVRVVNFLNKSRSHDKIRASPTDPSPAGYFHATSLLKATRSYGCSAWLNVWDPQINIPSSPGDDHSISQFWLQYAAPTQLLQSLEAGLTVDQGLNGDSNNHIFSFYTSNNYGNGNPANNIGGYNRLASGWVQTHPTIFPGIGVNGSSVQGGVQLEIGLKYQLFQGNWWLGISNNGTKPWVWLGYYPAGLFNGLSKNGTLLSFGGEVNSLLTNPCTTHDQMGSGVHASAGWRHAAYQRLLMNQTDAAGTLVNFSGVAEVDTAANNCPANMYTVQTFMNSDTNWASYQYYGGPLNYLSVRPGSPLASLYALSGDTTGSRVYFLNGNGHIDELAWENGWQRPTDTSVKPAPGSPLTGCYAATGDGTQGSRVYFLDANGYINELAWENGWQPPTATTVKPAPGSPLTCCYASSAHGTQGSRVYFLDANGYINELAWENGWQSPTATTVKPAPGSPLTCCYASSAHGTQGSRVYFLDANGYINELAWENGWQSPTATTVKPASGSSLTCCYAAASDDTSGSRVYFLGHDHNINELAWENGWQPPRPTPANAASASKLASLYAGELGSRVYYVGSALHLSEDAWSGSGFIASAILATTSS